MCAASRVGGGVESHLTRFWNRVEFSLHLCFGAWLFGGDDESSFGDFFSDEFRFEKFRFRNGNHFRHNGAGEFEVLVIRRYCTRR